MARTADAKTRHEAVYFRVRARLLRGEFGPGEPIRADQIAAAYGVSVSVAREALMRLSEQRLIVAQPNRGFRVTPLDVDTITDLSLVRSELEALTVGLAIERGDAAWEAAVVAAHHELAITARPSIAEDPDGNERWAILHSRFHAVCASGCGSPRLCATRQQYFDEAEVVRQFSRLQNTGRNVEQEHAELVDAIVARDAARAQAIVRSHVGRTTQSTLDALAALGLASGEERTGDPEVQRKVLL